MWGLYDWAIGETRPVDLRHDAYLMAFPSKTRYAVDK